MKRNTPTAFRLTRADIANLAEIRRLAGLKTTTEALRVALHIALYITKKAKNGNENND